MHARINSTGLTLLLSTAGVAHAHHSQAEFDTTTVRALEGTIARYEFTNPHVYIYLDSIDETGTPVTWELEASSTPNLVRRGWSVDSLSVGDRVTIRANPPRDSARYRARAISVAMINGGRLIVRGEGSVIPQADNPVAATSLSGIWLGRYGLEPFRLNLDSWPMTPKGRAAQTAYDGSQNPQINCVPVAAPLLMLYSNIYEISPSGDLLTIASEWMNAERVIYLDGRDHPATGERNNQGHSVGHWEGETLVIDSRLFSDSGAGNAFEIPSGAQKHVVERFSLNAGGRTLSYEFFLEDPEYLTEPVRGEGIWDYRPDLEALPNLCDPEVARRFLGGN